jgi:DNA mismatch endonuclease (patch repair protein)
MADVHSEKVRSYNMSRIKAKNTKPEVLVRKFLHNKGLRFRLHPAGMPGKPDVVLPKYKTVIFVHGCFWHGHAGCRYFVVPKTRTEFWTEKIRSNQIRDEKATHELTAAGWRVITVWECELKPTLREQTLNRLTDTITGPNNQKDEIQQGQKSAGD